MSIVLMTKSCVIPQINLHPLIAGQRFFVFVRLLGAGLLLRLLCSFSFAEKGLECLIHFLLILNDIMHELLLFQVTVG